MDFKILESFPGLLDLQPFREHSENYNFSSLLLLLKASLRPWLVFCPLIGQDSGQSHLLEHSVLANKPDSLVPNSASLTLFYLQLSY